MDRRLVEGVGGLDQRDPRVGLRRWPGEGGLGGGQLEGARDPVAKAASASTARAVSPRLGRAATAATTRPTSPTIGMAAPIAAPPLCAYLVQQVFSADSAASGTPSWAGPVCMHRCSVSHRRGVAFGPGSGYVKSSPNVLCLANEDAARMIRMLGQTVPACRRRGGRSGHRGVLDGAASGSCWWVAQGVFAGYFRDPAGAAAILSGGWLRTGDLVERDAEGYIKVVDRLKDIYISSSKNG